MSSTDVSISKFWNGKLAGGGWTATFKPRRCYTRYSNASYVNTDCNKTCVIPFVCVHVLCFNCRELHRAVLCTRRKILFDSERSNVKTRIDSYENCRSKLTMFSLDNAASSLSFIDLNNVQQVKRNLNEMLFNSILSSSYNLIANKTICRHKGSFYML